MSRRTADIQEARFRRAILVVGALMGALSIASLIFWATDKADAIAIDDASNMGPFKQSVYKGSLSGAILKSMFDGNDLGSAIEGSTSIKAYRPEELPDWIIADIGSAVEEAMDGKSPVLADPDRRVLGFTMAGSREGAIPRLVEALACNGWIGYGKGEEGILSLVRTEGEARWMVLQCAEVGEETSVVLHIVRG